MNTLSAWIGATLYVLGQKKKDRGATAVEYALMVAFIAIVIIGAVRALGGQLASIFDNFTTQLANA